MATKRFRKLVGERVIEMSIVSQGKLQTQVNPMTKVTGNDGFLSHSRNKQTVILTLCLIVLALSYVAEVASPGTRGDWSVSCCGRAFWSTPVGCALVLVGAALMFRVRKRWTWIIAALLSVFVSYDYLHMAAESWTFYYPLDKMQAFQEAFLLPLFRPLSGFLSLYIFVMALRNLVGKSNRTRSLPAD